MNESVYQVAGRQLGRGAWRVVAPKVREVIREAVAFDQLDFVVGEQVHRVVPIRIVLVIG